MTNIYHRLPTGAAKRLFLDSQELRLSPVSTDIHALPLENDLYEWHGNMRFYHFNGTTEEEQDHKNSEDEVLVIHFRLDFPDDYPHSPPSVVLDTPLPHTNVYRDEETGDIMFCLDMGSAHFDASYTG